MTRTQQAQEFAVWSHVCLLAGGVLILAGGLWMAFFMGSGAGWGMMGWMMGGAPSAGWFGLGWFMGLWTLVTGTLVLVAAMNIRAERDLTTWGTVGIVAGAASLLMMGVTVLGAIVAIVGGALAVVAEQRGDTARPG